MQDFDRHYDSSSGVNAPAPTLFSSEGLSGLKRVATVTVSGIKDGFVEAAQNCWTGKTGYDLAIGVASGLLLSLDTAATTRGGSVLLETGLVLTAAGAMLDHRQEIADAARDAYSGSNNLDADVDCMKKTLGQWVFDAVLIGAVSQVTHVAGEKLGLGIGASSLDKIRQNPLFDESNVLTNLERREARMASSSGEENGSLGYERSLLSFKSRQKYQTELKTFPLHHMFGFENDALISERAGITTWVQERTGANLHSYLRLGAGSGPTRYTSSPALQASVEEAFAERLIYGETDNHLENLGLRSIAPVPPVMSDGSAYEKAIDETKRVSNLDFHYAFGKEHPRGYRSADVPTWGNLGNRTEALHSKFINAPISEPLMNKIDAFKEKYGVKEVMSTGLSRSEAKALLNRVNWFSENRRFPGTPRDSDMSIAGRIQKAIYS